MEDSIIYHGSNVEVANPKILINGHYKDFGYGLYCTNIENCRRGVEHGYDIIEGSMTDDTIWDFVEDFAEGRIEREVFWAYAKFKYPTHQIVFCTEKALKCITFEGSDNLEK